MTIFRLYTENGHRGGFWVQHRDWSNRCAHVRSINGRTSGPLPVSELDDAAEVAAESFDVRSGRPVLIPITEPAGDKNFARIAEPPWYVRPREALH